jgi:hypothetical protein
MARVSAITCAVHTAQRLPTADAALQLARLSPHACGSAPHMYDAGVRGIAADNAVVAWHWEHAPNTTTRARLLQAANAAAVRVQLIKCISSCVRQQAEQHTSCATTPNNTYTLTGINSANLTPHTASDWSCSHTRQHSTHTHACMQTCNTQAKQAPESSCCTVRARALDEATVHNSTQCCHQTQ